MLKRWNPPLFSRGLSPKWVVCMKCLGYGERPCDNCEGQGCNLCGREGHSLCTSCRGLGEIQDRDYGHIISNPAGTPFTESIGDVF